MKLVRFSQYAPPVIIIPSTSGGPREIVNPNNDSILFYLNDVEYAYARNWVEIVHANDIAPGSPPVSGDLGDDRVDQFRGTITAVADPLSVDGYKWYRIAFTLTRRNISAVAETKPYWFTFEDPYVMANAVYTNPPPPGDLGNPDAPRYPAVWLQSAGQEEPYRDPTDPALVDQPYDANPWEYAWPKAVRITPGISVDLEIPLTSNWSRDAWVRTVDVTVGAPAATADVYVYAY
jgi:hypothetical protein